jgi:hypothetical protein
VAVNGEGLHRRCRGPWQQGRNLVSPGDPDVVTGPRRADRPAGVLASRRADPAGDAQRRTDIEDAPLTPPAGQPGHGEIAILRRQPARMVEGRAEGGYTSVFELICCDCGDHPYLDYSEVPPRLQWLRGPRTLEAGLAAYEKHLGLTRTA